MISAGDKLVTAACGAAFDWSVRGKSACQTQFVYCIPSRKYLNKAGPGSILILEMRASWKRKSKGPPQSKISKLISPSPFVLIDQRFSPLQSRHILLGNFQ